MAEHHRCRFVKKETKKQNKKGSCIGRCVGAFLVDRAAVTAAARGGRCSARIAMGWLAAGRASVAGDGGGLLELWLMVGGRAVLHGLTRTTSWMGTDGHNS